MRKLVLLLAGLVLLAVACGGGDVADESTTTSAGTVTNTATVPDESGTTSSTVPDEGGTTSSTVPDEGGTTSSTTVTGPPPELTSDSVVTLRAVGPVRIGMSVEEASIAARLALREDFGRQSTSSCSYVTVGAALPGVAFMVVDDLIARIEIDRPSPLATRSGVRIDTSADDLRTVYSDNIQRANDAVADGEAMAFVPNDDFDADFRIYFEIEDGAVARFRIGSKPAVDFLSGCPEE